MLQVGNVFAGYTVVRQIGAGGQDELYVARHPQSSQPVVLRLASPLFSGDADAGADFTRAADIAATISHPNLAAVYDRGTRAGRLWVVREMIDGTDLASMIRRGPLPLPEIARVVGDLASALDFANERGLPHLAVKPANVMVSTRGRVVLADFGTSWLVPDASAIRPVEVSVRAFGHAAPELFERMPDRRSDQYSLGATAYHLLTGMMPFPGTNEAAMILGHLTQPVPTVRAVRPQLIGRVDEVIGRAMAKAPADRFPSSVAFAAEFAEALAGVDGRSAAAPPPRQTSCAFDRPPRPGPPRNR